MKIFKKMKKGFTLVELVVVIAVIAILAAVSVGAYFGITDSANASKLEQEAKQVHTAIQTVALAPNEHSSLTSNGLTITDVDSFKDELEKNLGNDVYFSEVEGEYEDSMPTIYFSTNSISAIGGSDVTYKTFQYYLPEIGNKKAVADVVTGEVKAVASTNTSVNAPVEVSLERAIEIGTALESGKTTTQEYILEGQITSIANFTYGNLTITVEETSFYIYGLYQGDVRYDDLTNKPDVGDSIKVQGVIKNYNGSPQMVDAQLLDHVEGEIPTTDPIEIDLVRANQIGSEQSNNAYTTQQYIVEGTIAEILDSYHGNMTITDGENNFSIYGLNKEDVRYGNLTEKPALHDTVKLQGIIGNYNGNPQMKDAELLEFTKNESAVITDIASALTAKDGTSVVLTGEVVKIDQSYNETYGNISVTIEDENSDKILAYRLVGNVNLHDNITVIGTMDTDDYNNRRIAEKCTFVKNGSENHRYVNATCTQPETCTICGHTVGTELGHTEPDDQGKCERCGGNIAELELTKTVTFIPKDKGHSNAEVVTTYTDGTIIVTFDKGTNSNDPKYYDTGEAIRIYGGSTFTVANSAGIIKQISLSFASGEGSNTITSDQGEYSEGEWTGSSNSVTFTIDGTSGHRRIYSIEITYVEGNVSDDPEQPTLISITPNEANVSFDAIDETKTISITANYSNNTTAPIDASNVTWISNKGSVATVANGVITPVANGDATITASYEGKTTTISVNVNISDDNTDVELTEKTYSYEFVKGDQTKFTSNKTQKFNNVSWTVEGTEKFNWDGNTSKGVQLGTGDVPAKTLSFYTSDFNGKQIKSITINTSGASNINGNFVIKFGNTVLTEETALTKTATVYPFDFAEDTICNNNLCFCYTQTSSKAIYIASIEVVYFE